jgi:hypothetical protein
VCSAASTAEQKFFHSWEALGAIESCDWRSRGAGLEENLAHLTIEERFGKILKRLLRERFYFRSLCRRDGIEAQNVGYVNATLLRVFLDCRAQKR